MGECEVCGSTDLEKTEEGYVCKDCGYEHNG